MKNMTSSTYFVTTIAMEIRTGPRGLAFISQNWRTVCSHLLNCELWSKRLTRFSPSIVTSTMRGASLRFTFGSPKMEKVLLLVFLSRKMGRTLAMVDAVCCKRDHGMLSTLLRLEKTKIANMVTTA